MRYWLLLICLHLTVNGHAQPKEAWFQYDETSQRYQIDALNVHPAAFFKEFSLHSGIEIQFDQGLTEPVDFYMTQGTQDQLIGFLEKQYSTLLTFKKDQNNIETLTSISVLPKGQFQSSKMVVAVDPLEETINFKQNIMSQTAKPVYLTRLNHIENKVRQNLEQQAERTIKKREARLERMDNIKQQKKERDQQKLAELAAIKQSDPKLYAAQKAIYFPDHKTKE